jgi:hypothetical protein
MVSPGKWKCITLRCVCAPHKRLLGTSMLPIVSRSTLNFAIAVPQ